MDILKATDTKTGEPALPTQAGIEATPIFKAFCDAKKQEAKDYVMNAFGLEVNLEDLIIWRDDAGWPDPMGKAASHKIIVSNQKYRDKEGNTLGNYNVWRKLPPAPTDTEMPINS
ncbi:MULTISPECIES: hypothetical protein [unclassified Microcoleus]|uniref:hypothetical protein n=1 Tax=unclassified Microcoleus TaxID=2642155 RepID=UPI001D78EAF2|nr:MULTISPECIES: hypothetical protein [unclassified Microcoleus]MCC3506239.1 hypothetical protein [Microcoleus sp. PH2017_19_SFW_U_A]MCC3523960.1 hypothetical protein [Microcoleus sp. PH2017_20_SFW_D_A]MCC3554970.1 hypothetical protein [Microcoleus sp. PH2017_35_SFW_U_B]MCC3564507.1 hypothetical protein [Microcoleus sp. PH2017_31_RDM_U_A]MCC3577932.1 hypothetical protein [Microcoleus sp. PH2017_32_RDM_D_A]